MKLSDIRINEYGDKYRIVNDCRTLNAMEKRGLIKLAPQTGSKITGIYGGRAFTCTYIDEAPVRFDYNGNKYGYMFFDGCFYPYVIQYQ